MMDDSIGKFKCKAKHNKDKGQGHHAHTGIFLLKANVAAVVTAVAL
jgi:hypothetical protein